jgi:ADP-heptose:LPS heptosyltransferase
VITPDTSTAHIASAENKPIVGLYPVANDWLPYNIPATIILSEPGKLISEIPLEVVKQAAIKMMTDPPINSMRIIPSAEPEKIEVRSY